MAPHRAVGQEAESLQPYLTKGKQIYVEGRLQTRQWEKDGQKHYTTEIKADRIVLLGGGGGGGGAAAGGGSRRVGYADPQKEAAPITDDEFRSETARVRCSPRAALACAAAGRHYVPCRP